MIRLCVGKKPLTLEGSENRVTGFSGFPAFQVIRDTFLRTHFWASYILWTQEGIRVEWGPGYLYYLLFGCYDQICEDLRAQSVMAGQA